MKLWKKAVTSEEDKKRFSWRVRNQITKKWYRGVDKTTITKKGSRKLECDIYKHKWACFSIQ